MYQPTDLKKGVVFQLEGQPYKVIEYNQKVVGRGGSIVNVKIKNLITGTLLPKTFKGQDKVEPAEVTRKKVQYLYNDGEDLPKDIIDDASGYLKEGEEIDLQFFDNKVINIELPKNVWLKVVYTENVVKGDTTSSVLKDAELETGVTIKVPAFIKENDVISVDTENGNYRERQK